MGENIIAHGAHGCIVKALPCEIKKSDIIYEPNEKYIRSLSTNTDNVSKIFINKDSWEMEQQEAEKITKIPDYQKYFIVPLAACSIDKNPEYNVLWKKCEKKTEKTLDPEEDRLYHFILNNGGVSIAQYLGIPSPGEVQPVFLTDWLKILLQILKCLKVLAEAHLVHMDLKLENVVYNTKTGKVKLIDFGLTSSFKDVYYISDKYLEREIYPYWPIDFKIHQYCYHDVIKVTEKEFKCNAKNIETIYMMGIIDVYNLCIDYGIIDKDHSKQTEIIENLINGYDTRDELARTDNIYLAKIDIYSLGISCLYAHKYGRLKVSSGDKKYIELVRNMCNIDYRKRISIDDAIERVNIISKTTLSKKK